MEETLQFRRRILPSDHPDLASSMWWLVRSYGMLERDKEALAVLVELLIMQLRMYSLDHQDTSRMIEIVRMLYMQLRMPSEDALLTSFLHALRLSKAQHVFRH